MKKGQAALEFLTTYAWAFLVILIMIGALAYFGILSPSRLLPDRCNFGPEVDCRDFQITHGTGTDGTIKIKLKNNVGEAINIDSMSVSAESVTPLSCTGGPDITGVWAASEIRDFTFSTCNSAAIGFVSGEKGKVEIRVKYYAVRSGPGYIHDVNGEVFSTVV